MLAGNMCITLDDCAALCKCLNHSIRSWRSIGSVCLNDILCLFVHFLHDWCYLSASLACSMSLSLSSNIARKGPFYYRIGEHLKRFSVPISIGLIPSIPLNRSHSFRFAASLFPSFKCFGFTIEVNLALARFANTVLWWTA